MVTDAKALYDSYHREGVSSTVVDTAAIEWPASMDVFGATDGKRTQKGISSLASCWVPIWRYMGSWLMLRLKRKARWRSIPFGGKHMQLENLRLRSLQRRWSPFRRSLSTTTFLRMSTQYEMPNEEDIQTLEAEQSLEVHENAFMARTSEVLKHDFATSHVGSRENCLKRRVQNDIARSLWWLAVSLSPGLAKGETDQRFAADEPSAL